jgi:signal peptidase I
MSTVGAHARQRTGRAHLVPAPVRWVARVLVWVVILVCVAALAVGIAIPRLTGATPYTILTGSMTPTYPPGTLVVDKPADPDSVGVGTVVTYQLESGKPAVVTHRVVAVTTTVTGEQRFITQGDANPAPDEEPVRPEQIRGQVWYAVPQLGRVSVLFSGHERQLLTYGIAGLLGLYALSMFAGAFRDRRRPSPAPVATEEDVACVR